MSTVIDSLIVTLGLDSKDVDAKAPGVRKKLAELEKSAGKTEEGFKGIGKASKGTASELTVLSAKLGSFLAVIGGTVAVRSFIKDTIENNTQLYFLSRNLEMSTQKLYAWGAAAQEIGGSAGTIQNFMRTIAAMPGELLLGKMPQLLPLFARLGINMREPFDQIMVDISKRFSGMDRKVAFSFGVASGIPEDVMNLILQGPNAVQAAMARTKGFGPTEKEAASAAKLKLQITDLELQFVKIGYDLLQKVTPALEKFLGLVQKIGEWARSHENIALFIAGVAAALAGVVSLGSAIGFITIGLNALLPVLEAVGVAFVAALPTLGVVGVVLAIASAIGLLWQDYKVWTEGGNSYFDWGEFASGIKKAEDAFEGLADKIENATSSFGKWIGAHGGNAAKSWLKSHGIDFSLEDLSRTSTDRDVLAYQIASREGFYDKHSGGFVPNDNGKGSHWSATANENIPQKAHNPGDIEYGDFARSHGANGYVIAKGGKKIATFPDDKVGWDAMYSLLGSKGYAGLSQDAIIRKWQTGSAIINGIPSATRLSSSVSSSSSMSNSTSNDNSRVTHIGTINVQNPSGSSPMTAPMARGMDWTTLLTQQNGGLQ